MRTARHLAAVLALATTAATLVGAARPALDAQDRAAFRGWFTLLADAQFYRPTSEVIDCAALVRHAAREALRVHTPEWLRRASLPFAPVLPDVRARLEAADGHLPVFRVAATPTLRYAEFADADTILRLNAERVSRDAAAARPGDLLAFHQPGQSLPQHLMVYVGRSHFEYSHDDWVVYHTGPDRTAGTPGEMRKARLSDLRRHPAPRWRPDVRNPAFLGVYRLTVP